MIFPLKVSSVYISACSHLDKLYITNFVRPFNGFYPKITTFLSLFGTNKK